MRIRRVFAAAAAVLLGVGLSVAIASPAAATTLGPFRIVIPGFNECLDVRGVSYADGASIQTYTCLPNQWNQQWTLYSISPNYYEIKPTHSQKCLDVEGVSMNPGARIQQHWCVGWWQYNQHFSIQYVPQNGHYWINARHSGMCVSWVGPYVADGNDVIQDWCSYARSNWDLVPW